MPPTKQEARAKGSPALNGRSGNFTASPLLALEKLILPG
jgi:hypothetical protein